MVFCHIIFFFRDNETEKLSSPFRLLKLKGKAFHAVEHALTRRGPAWRAPRAASRAASRPGAAWLYYQSTRRGSRRDEIHSLRRCASAESPRTLAREREPSHRTVPRARRPPPPRPCRRHRLRGRRALRRRAQEGVALPPQARRRARRRLPRPLQPGIRVSTSCSLSPRTTDLVRRL